MGETNRLSATAGIVWQRLRWPILGNCWVSRLLAGARSAVAREGDHAQLPSLTRQLIPLLLGSYHPSRQNTSTRWLTAAMLDDVLLRAREVAAPRAAAKAAAGCWR